MFFPHHSSHRPALLAASSSFLPLPTQPSNTIPAPSPPNSYAGKVASKYVPKAKTVAQPIVLFSSDEDEKLFPVGKTRELRQQRKRPATGNTAVPTPRHASATRIKPAANSSAATDASTQWSSLPAATKVPSAAGASKNNGAAKVASADMKTATAGKRAISKVAPQASLAAAPKAGSYKGSTGSASSSASQKFLLLSDLDSPGGTSRDSKSKPSSRRHKRAPRLLPESSSESEVEQPPPKVRRTGKSQSFDAQN